MGRPPLGTLIANEINSEPGEPRVIADRVLRRLDDGDLRAALEEALPNYVRVVMTNRQRPALRAWIDAATDTEPDSGDIPEVTVFAASEWKQLPDCSPDDFRNMAERRTRLASGVAAWADRFSALAEGLGVTPRPVTAFDADAASLASVAVLSARKRKLEECLAQESSPVIDELQRRRDALIELRDALKRDAEEHERFVAELNRREALHGAR